MSDANAFDLGKFIPGFDFLQKLAAERPGARGAAAGLGNWVAPTVSVEELERRIKDLRAVQFWLEQNVVAVKATIQALEVQKMTLATLRGMNVSMTEVAKAFTLPTGSPASATAPAAAKDAPAQSSAWPYAPAPAEAEPPAAEPPAEPARRPRRAKPARRASGKAAEAAAPAAGLADPVQWWGALTQQFQQIAASALREAGRAAPEATPAAETAIDSAAAGADQAGAEAPKAAKKPAARKKAPAKKAARKAAAKPAAKAVPSAKKAAKPAPRSPLAGWPLPPAFKLGRR
ncbi:MAG: hypothetical protein QM772_13315 [Ottowia sp.]|uniref:PhaM family polyhydroxyalkanoate granule multifunctional regulatory protein n=1 Tax=Ottowia sp. TaxID=1898956 RepID=UPI0039E62F02